ncbi:MAG TPA: hypothetical protein VKV15_25085 [Bryobacteraceae bacterium]|nr:hypothetical protein [Bryobacteraceae bacterium]
MPGPITSAALPADVFSAPPLVRSSGGKQDTPEKIKQAASQFEALMIGQMLQSVREGGSGDFMGTDDDESGSSLLEMAEQQFAQAMAAHGGLGLAKMVSDGLAAKR